MDRPDVHPDVHMADIDQPLITAVERLRKDEATEQLQAGENPDVRDTAGKTALMRTITDLYILPRYPHSFMKLLLHHNADVTLTNNKGHTASVIALDLGNLKALQILFAFQADPRARDRRGRTLQQRATARWRANRSPGFPEKSLRIARYLAENHPPR